MASIERCKCCDMNAYVNKAGYCLQCRRATRRDWQGELDAANNALARETAARAAAEALADKLRQTVFDLIGSQQLGDAQYKAALERATQAVLEAEGALFGDAALSAGRAQTGGEEA